MSGRTHSDATKTKISDAMTGKNHPNYGKTLNDETKKKILFSCEACLSLPDKSYS